MRQHFSTRAAVRTSAPVDRKAAPTTPIPLIDRHKKLTFTPLASELAPAILAREGSGSAKDKAALRAQFSDILAGYKSRLARSGGEQTDVSRAAAYLFGVSYQTYHERGVLPQRQFDAIRNQLGAEFLASTEFAAKDNGQRQIEFETYAILGTCVELLDMVAKEEPSPSARDRARILAREAFIGLMGVSPDHVVIGEEGFRLVGAPTRPR